MLLVSPAYNMPNLTLVERPATREMQCAVAACILLQTVENVQLTKGWLKL
jgi:hypothetical protein